MQTTTPTSPWLTLTDLGRLYGISAVHCGHLLTEAGLRGANGQPSATAVAAGQAFSRAPRHQGRAVLWHRDGCGAVLEDRGLVPLRRSTLVDQWATLLSALAEGAAAISTSAAQMAEELPPDLVDAVNGQLQAMGCSFQVGRPRGGQPQRNRPACAYALPSPAEPSPAESVKPAGRPAPRRRAAAKAGPASPAPAATPRGDHQRRSRSRA